MMEEKKCKPCMEKMLRAKYRDIAIVLRANANGKETRLSRAFEKTASGEITDEHLTEEALDICGKGYMAELEKKGEARGKK